MPRKQKTTPNLTNIVISKSIKDQQDCEEKIKTLSKIKIDDKELPNEQKESSKPLSSTFKCNIVLTPNKIGQGRGKPLT